MAPIEKDDSGFWGEATATIDWCEANYEVSHYIAEFWNTISNFFMVVPPLLGACLAFKDRFENRFMWCHLTLLLVGVGSSAFHGTLLYEMQMADELPMIFGTAVMLYTMMEVKGAPRSHNRTLQAALIAYCVVVSLVYIIIQSPVFHEIAYGVLVLGMILSSIRIVRRFDHSFGLFISGLGFYTAGFLLWNLDNVYCGHLRRMRAQVSPGLRPILQGHAWWHVFAGLGTYLTLLFNMHARQQYLKKPAHLKMVLGVWPFVRK